MSFNISSPPEDLKKLSSSAYYKEQYAVELLPVVVALLAKGEDVYLACDAGTTPLTLSQKVTAAWKYLVEQGPQIEELRALDVPWEAILTSRQAYSISLYQSGVMIKKKEIKVASPQPKKERKIKAKAKVDWEAQMEQWLDKPSPKEALLLECLDLSDAQQDKTRKILKGLDMYKYAVSQSTLYIEEGME